MADVSRRKVLGTAALSLACGVAAPAHAELTTKHGFNDEALDWLLLDEGIEKATETKRPILLLAHTTWCPHCTLYKELFFKKDVLAALEPYVCCLIDRDEQPDLNDAYSPDGGYVPRTMVLGSDGSHLPMVRGPNPAYKYLMPNDDAETLVAFLENGAKTFENPDFEQKEYKSRFLRFLQNLDKKLIPSDGPVTSE